jgi:hypothetical protein
MDKTKGICSVISVCSMTALETAFHRRDATKNVEIAQKNAAIRDGKRCTARNRLSVLGRNYPRGKRRNRFSKRPLNRHIQTAKSNWRKEWLSSMTFAMMQCHHLKFKRLFFRKFNFFLQFFLKIEKTSGAPFHPHSPCT